MARELPRTRAQIRKAKEIARARGEKNMGDLVLKAYDEKGPYEPIIEKAGAFGVLRKKDNKKRVNKASY